MYYLEIVETMVIESERVEELTSVIVQYPLLWNPSRMY